MLKVSSCQISRRFILFKWTSSIRCVISSESLLSASMSYIQLNWSSNLNGNSNMKLTWMANLGRASNSSGNILHYSDLFICRSIQSMDRSTSLYSPERPHENVQWFVDDWVQQNSIWIQSIALLSTPHSLLHVVII